MEEEKYLPELMAERDSLDPSFLHASRLLAEEIEKFQGSDGKSEDEEEKYLDVISNKNIKLSERVLIPVKQYPKHSFKTGGNSVKLTKDEASALLVDECPELGTQAPGEEEELRKSGEAKYAHLSDELHVLIEVFAPPGEAYSRMSHALEEIKKFLVPDYNDEIRQEQLRELSYLNGSEDSGRGRGVRGRGIRIAPTAPSRAMWKTPQEHTPKERDIGTVHEMLSWSPKCLYGLSAFSKLQEKIATTNTQGYDGYGGEYDDEIYETYDNSYPIQAQSVPEYYDYGHGVSEDAYDSYGNHKQRAHS
ncbi:hypothetical protein E5288_WYG011375 [Bos mutus]|uniref:KH domain-containing, RNA-binding, signal transduction-associated protein 2 n=1 Tax=Bos mutus TaxID=72004 RepID=A0A6B0RDT4_9CETA|nr:hypothetical protein [Bos mutus]